MKKQGTLQIRDLKEKNRGISPISDEQARLIAGGAWDDILGSQSPNPTGGTCSSNGDCDS